MKTIYINPKQVDRKWYLIDAEGQILGRIAVEAAKIVRGKNKAYYTPHQNIGDSVVIINSGKIRVTGQKYKNKLYYRHTGYPGGLRVETYEKLSGRKPTSPLEKAIKGMLPKNRLGRQLFRQIKVYAGPDHPHTSQKPIKYEIE